jgi:hypothetical protein
MHKVIFYYFLRSAIGNASARKNRTSTYTSYAWKIDLFDFNESNHSNEYERLHEQNGSYDSYEWYEYY